MRGADLLGIINQVKIRERSHGEIPKAFQRFAKHRQAVLQRKSVAFVRIDADGHDQSVKEGNSLLDHPEMSDSKRIKAPGVNTQSLLCSHALMVATNARVSATHARR